ncbi:MAG: seryl-tRNA synthetase [Cyclobacteriaceae bacterium]|jgi:seryl-tRNA synthetase
MLQLEYIAENFDKAVAGLKKRGLLNGEDILQEVLSTNNNRKKIQQELDETKAQSNLLAKEIGSLFKSGKQEEANQLKTKTTSLKEESKSLADQLQSVNVDLQNLLYAIPNIPNESVPSGKSEVDNQEIKRDETHNPTLTAHAKPHWDLIEEYDIVDFELGNKVTGAGFPFYKGQGARLSRALVNYFLDFASDAGYDEIQPPILVNEESGYGTGQLPDKEGQMYQIADTNLFLIPTGEVPITNMFRDVIVSEAELPIKKVGFTPCFRREAGSWGAHVRGLNRLHQFDKVEIVQIARPQDSYEILDAMINHVENLLKTLELPYRILRLCAGDLGFTSAITYDFEVYSAAQKKWLEVSSISNFESFQANRLKLRIKDKDNKKILAHTLNGSALALPRIMAAILENNQTDEGINIPQVLQKYTGYNKIVKK